MTDSRQITLAIHTYEKALPIKAMLEREGISVELNNVNLQNPEISAGVRIRIKESDLPLALRLIENIEIFELPELEPVIGGKILVPTDFSSHSRQAAELAMKMASKLQCDIEFLFAFVPPTNAGIIQLSESYEYELADIDASRKLKEEATHLMKQYTDSIREQIKKGDLPAVKFSGFVAEGIPEEVINEYARNKKPQLIVMGTRGASQKEAELIGSVTAEVLDNCRVPAFTVPHNVDPELLRNLKKAAFFCNLDQEDILALDALYRLFHDIKLEVTLVHIPGRHWLNAPEKDAQHQLLSYCINHFPRYKFDIATLNLKNIERDVSKLVSDSKYQLICCPNKHKNVFARVFNPSLAHKILFRADIPMIVIPV